METSMLKKKTLDVGKKSTVSKTKSPASKTRSKDQPTEYIDVAQQEAMIAKAAYFKAMQRDFVAGHEMDDWLAAEADIYGLVYWKPIDGALTLRWSIEGINLLLENRIGLLLRSLLSALKKCSLFIMVATCLSACNTVQGLGKDIEKGGEVIQKSAK